MGSRDSNYQWYRDKEGSNSDNNSDTFESEPSITAVAFIPRFKVQKEFEKCAQTSDSPTQEEKNERNEKALTERVLADVLHVLQEDADEGTDGIDERAAAQLIAPEELDDTMQLESQETTDVVSPSDLFSPGAGSEYQSLGISSLWEDDSLSGANSPAVKVDPRSAANSIWSSKGLEREISPGHAPLSQVRDVQYSDEPLHQGSYHGYHQMENAYYQVGFAIFFCSFYMCLLFFSLFIMRLFEIEVFASV